MQIPQHILGLSNMLDAEKTGVVVVIASLARASLPMKHNVASSAAVLDSVDVNEVLTDK